MVKHAGDVSGGEWTTMPCLMDSFMYGMRGDYESSLAMYGVLAEVRGTVDCRSVCDGQEVLKVWRYGSSFRTAEFRGRMSCGER